MPVELIDQKAHVWWDPVTTITDKDGVTDLWRPPHLYEVRRGIYWGTAVCVGITSCNEILTRNFSTESEDWMVRLLDVDRHYLGPPAKITADLPLPTGWQSLTLRDEVSLGFPGTKTNCEVDGDGNLTFSRGETTATYQTAEIDFGALAYWDLTHLVHVTPQDFSFLVGRPLYTFSGQTFGDQLGEPIGRTFGDLSDHDFGGPIYDPDVTWSLEVTVYTTSGIPGTFADISSTAYYGRFAQLKLTLTRRNATGDLEITGATNATPIVITTGTNHNLRTGRRVRVFGVLGNTAADGTWSITRLSDTTFELDGSAGNGAYTSGGTAVSGIWGRVGAMKTGYVKQVLEPIRGGTGADLSALADDRLIKTSGGGGILTDAEVSVTRSGGVTTVDLPSDGVLRVDKQIEGNNSGDGTEPSIISKSWIQIDHATTFLEVLEAAGSPTFRYIFKQGDLTSLGANLTINMPSGSNVLESTDTMLLANPLGSIRRKTFRPALTGFGTDILMKLADADSGGNTYNLRLTGSLGADKNLDIPAPGATTTVHMLLNRDSTHRLLDTTGLVSGDLLQFDGTDIAPNASTIDLKSNNIINVELIQFEDDTTPVSVKTSLRVAVGTMPDTANKEAYFPLTWQNEGSNVSASDLAFRELDQEFTGRCDFSSRVRIQETGAGTDWMEIEVAVQTADRKATIPELSADDIFSMLGVQQTITADKTWDGGANIIIDSPGVIQFEDGAGGVNGKILASTGKVKKLEIDTADGFDPPVVKFRRDNTDPSSDGAIRLGKDIDGNGFIRFRVDGTNYKIQGDLA